jgi:MoaA/NifB/PqqE/SkfB family radical SAM enzyme
MVSFIGNGEPMLNKDFFKMVAHAREKKLSVSMFTNGILLGQHIGDILKNNVQTINISINAANYLEYRRFTGSDQKVYEQCVDNIRELVQKKKETSHPIEVSCSIIVDKKNYKDIPEMISFAEDLGIDSLTLCHYMPNPSKPEDAKERCIFKSDQRAWKFIKKLALKEYKIPVSFPQLIDDNPDNRLCRASLYSMSIDGDGNIGGCERQLLNTEGQGKYWDKDVFNNDHMKELRRCFLKHEGELKGPCKTCYNNSTCEVLKGKIKNSL